MQQVRESLLPFGGGAIAWVTSGMAPKLIFSLVNISSFLSGPSRRSDLESLGYCLLQWLCGFLPWSDELDKVETVMEKKEK